MGNIRSTKTKSAPVQNCGAVKDWGRNYMSPDKSETNV